MLVFGQPKLMCPLLAGLADLGIAGVISANQRGWDGQGLNADKHLRHLGAEKLPKIRSAPGVNNGDVENRLKFVAHGVQG